MQKEIPQFMSCTRRNGGNRLIIKLPNKYQDKICYRHRHNSTGWHTRIYFFGGKLRKQIKKITKLKLFWSQLITSAKIIFKGYLLRTSILLQFQRDFLIFKSIIKV